MLKYLVSSVAGSACDGVIENFNVVDNHESAERVAVRQLRLESMRGRADCAPSVRICLSPGKLPIATRPFSDNF